MNVLVINAGSSSLKFQLVRTDAERIAAHTDEKLARGQIERIGGEAVITLRGRDGRTVKDSEPLRDLRAAVEFIVSWLASAESGPAIGTVGEIDAVGHRVVHGGERFKRSVRIDDDVLEGIEDMIELAPLHNPHNLKAVAAAKAVLGADVPHVAVFDTAFHHTVPERAYLYAIPYQLYRRHKVRRYGFHGTSHRYVAYRWRELTGVARDKTRIITLHLGNGCSACAIDGGNSVDTSMGFTPLEGLVMGTRSGDLDPAVLEYLGTKEGLSPSGVDNLLNKQSGLLGLSGLTNDMRELLAEAQENNDRRARLAIDIFCYRARKYIGAYLAALGGADAIVFAGGIGENAPEVRSEICRGLEWAGVELDVSANEQMVSGAEGRITTASSRLAVWVIPTDEELLIARDTFRAVAGVEARY
ncbi:MAG TPA: acetate kinase [Gemmatimonadaceae bacterium]|nr:acetate kinase [Gemmatimonadaceae bacterium]